MGKPSPAESWRSDLMRSPWLPRRTRGRICRSALWSTCRASRATRLQPLDGSHLLFPDGDRLMRVIVGATTDTALEVQSHSALGKLTIPLDAVLGLVLAPPGESDAFDQLWEQVRGEKRTTDVVWMANGDRQTGGFLGLDDRVVNFQVEGKPVEIDRTGVIAVGFDPAVTNYPRPKGDFLDVTLADGSRLGVVDVKLDKGQVTATARFGQSIRFPISDLVRLEPRTPAVEYLSERPIDAQSYESYFGPTRRGAAGPNDRRSSISTAGPRVRPRPGNPEPNPAGLPLETRRSALSGARRRRRPGGPAGERGLSSAG